MAMNPEIEAKLRAASKAGMQANQKRAQEAQKKLQAAQNAEREGKLDEAFKIYTGLYNEGFIPAAFFLGNLFMHRGYRAVEEVNQQTGQTVRRPDYPSAHSWYKKAADRGVREAMSNLGVMYTLGQGCEKDPETGKKYLIRARDAGSEEARAFLFQNFPDQRSTVSYTDEEYTELLSKFIELSTAGNANECHKLFFKLVCGNDEQLSSLGTVLALHKYSTTNPFVNRMNPPAFPKMTNGMPCAPVYLAKRAPGASTLHMNPRCFPEGKIRLTLCSTIEDLTIFPLSGIEDVEDGGFVTYRAVPLGTLPTERGARILEFTPEEDAEICIFTENGEKEYIVELGWLDEADQLHFLFRYSIDMRVPDNPGLPQVISITPPEEYAEDGETEEVEETADSVDSAEAEEKAAESDENDGEKKKSKGFFKKRFNK